MPKRQDLHELVDELPEGELETAHRLLQHLGPGTGSEEELSPEELAEIDEARQEIKTGKFFTLQQIRQENDL